MSEDSPKKKSKNPLLRYFLWGFLSLVTAYNFSLSLLFIFNKPFYPDEFQHTHIVWNMFHNAKLIYADFWEHHGVVYPVVNYVLFSVFDLDADFSTFTFLRCVSFFYMVILAYITFQLAQLLFRSHLLSFLSVAILSSIYYFHLNGIEIRPDQLQNIFWLLGLYVIIAHLRKDTPRAFYVSGILFGLAIAANTKAILGIAFVFLFLFLNLILQKAQFRANLFKLVAICLGIVSVLGFIVLCFYALGGGEAYLRSNYYYNWVLLGMDKELGMLPFYWKEIYTHQLPLLILTCLSFLLLLWEVATKRCAEHVLFLWVTAGSTSTILLGMYSQSFLVFLPLLAILCAYGATRVFRLLKINTGELLVFSPILLLLFFVPMEDYLVERLNSIDREPVLLQEQKDLSRFMLKHTQRSEPVFFFWNVCGGYVFNEDVQYYWSYNLLHGETARAIAGYDVYGDDLIRALEDKKVRFIIADPGEHRDLLSPRSRQYIENNYIRLNKCLLKRK